MDYLEILKNKEIGKLIQYAYDLHKRDLVEDYTGIANIKHPIPTIKFYKNGAIRGIVFFGDHSTVDATIELLVIKDFDENDDPKNCILFYTNTEDYRPGFYELKMDSKKGELVYKEGKTPEEKYNRLIEFLEFTGFRREDIIKVINKEMTAREAYQNVADEEYKNRQWICYERKFYEFDKNIAIDGDYSAVYLNSFPFPFDDQPILDCSKVYTGGVYFQDNKKQVKLINVNKNKKSIVCTDLKEAIIDEVIDASIVDISFTTFGEQRVINLDKAISSIRNNKYIRLAITDEDENIEKRKVRLLSTTSSIDTTIDALSNGTEGIGLFRDEALLESDLEITRELVNIINSDWWITDCDQPFLDKIENLFYNNASKLFSILNDIPITFRLSDIKKDELARKAQITLDEEVSDIRGARALMKLREMLCAEAKGLLRAAKEHNITLNLLIPYTKDDGDVVTIKNLLRNTIKEVDYNTIRFGAMIESFEGYYNADKIAEKADFISIGTNDLTESVLKKERNIDDKDFQILNEEVKKYINKIVHRVKRTKDIPINICGEHSNYFENIPYYLSLNIDTISCNPTLLHGYNNFLNNYYESNKEKKKEIE